MRNSILLLATELFFAAFAHAATPGNYAMAESVDQNSVCNAPTPASIFLTKDASAYAWFTLSGIQTGDVVNAVWLDPSGNTYANSPFKPATSSGGFCYWSSIGIAGNRAASLLGGWSVAIQVNGAMVFRMSFAVGTSRVHLDSQIMARTVSGSCTSPAPVATFLTSDQQAYAWFLVDNAAAGDQIQATWYRPDNSVYGTANFAPVSGNGSYCFWSNIPVSGNSGAQPGSWKVQVTWNGSPLFTSSFAIQPPALVPQVSSVVNAASLDASAFAQGSLVILTGSNPGVQATTPPGSQALSSLAGVSVTFDGVPAPLLYADSQSIIAQVPWTRNDSAMVQTVVNGVAADPYPVTLAPSAPGVFTASGDGTGLAQAWIYAADGSDKGWMAPDNPAAPTDTLLIQTTGLGLVSNPPATGQPGSWNPAAPSTLFSPVSVQIGGLPAQVLLAVMDDQVPGFYDVWVSIPKYAPTGSAVPLTLYTLAGAAQQTTLNLAPGQPQPNPAVLSSVSNSKPAPFSLLQISGQFDTAAPAMVHFTDGKNFSSDVPPSQLTATSVKVIVPPYTASSTSGTGPGTVSVSVVYPVSGQPVASNALPGVQIQDLPPLASAPGKLMSALFSAVQQGQRAQIAQLLLQEKSGAGTTTNARAQLTTGISQIASVANALSPALSGGTASVSFGGKTVQITSADIAQQERIITGFVDQQLPPGALTTDPLAAAPDPNSPRPRDSAGSNTNDCMVPTMAEIYDAAHGGPQLVQGVPYATRLQYCMFIWQSYNNLNLATGISQSATDVGNTLDNWMIAAGLVNDVGGAATTLSTESASKALTGATLGSWVAQGTAQTIGGLIATGFTAGADPNDVSNAMQIVSVNSKNLLLNVAQSKLEEGAADGLPEGDTLKDLLDANLATLEAVGDGTEDDLEPGASTDSSGNVQLTLLPPPLSGITLDGTVNMAPGQSASGIQVSLDPYAQVAPGNGNDLGVAAVYNDGSYQIIVPPPGGAVPGQCVLDVQDPSGWYTEGDDDLDLGDQSSIYSNSPEASGSGGSVTAPPPPPSEGAPPPGDCSGICAGSAESVPPARDVAQRSRPQHAPVAVHPMPEALRKKAPAGLPPARRP